MIKKYILLLIVISCSQALFAQPPTITSFFPTTAGPNDTVTIYGTNLFNVYEVRLGGYLVNFNILSSTEILAFEMAGASSGDVTVTSDSGTASLPGFTWNGYPVITSISPDTASAGQTVTITGKYIAAGVVPMTQAVSFGSVSATSFKAVSFTQVTAVVGNGASGSVSLKAIYGTATYPGFVFKAIPTIASFSPTTATTGTTVIIKGEYFTGATAVSFGGVAAQSFSVLADSIISAVVGNGASGNISITTAIGTGIKPGFSTCVTVYGVTNNVSICSMQLPYQWDGKNIMASGNYIDTIKSYKGCDSIITLNLAVKSIRAPQADSVIYYTQNSAEGSLTAVADSGNSLLWYNASTGGIGSTTPPIPNTAIIANTTYYVSQTSGVCEGPRTKIVVIVSGNISIQLCPVTDKKAILISNIKGTTYQWYFLAGTRPFVTTITLADDSNIVGSNKDTLFASNIPDGWFSCQFFCTVDGNNNYGNTYVFSVANNWTGTTSSAWEDTTNWSCGALPDSKTDVIINGGTAVLSSNTSVRSLTVSPSASFIIVSPFNLTVTH